MTYSTTRAKADLAAQVRAGILPAAAAARMAGFQHASSPVDMVRKAIPMLGDDDVRVVINEAQAVLNARMCSCSLAQRSPAADVTASTKAEGKQRDWLLV
jgi:hypothetical protein